MKEDVEDIQFYERKVKTTLCLIKQCNLRSEEIPSDMVDELDRKMPYNYLQLCYLKVSYYVQLCIVHFEHFEAL